MKKGKPIGKGNNTIQAAWLGIGGIMSFSFATISAAIISRYLTKEEYGTYKQVMYEGCLALSNFLYFHLLPIK